MKTCLISRYGGYGDVLHASHLPELIKKHYGVDHLTFETSIMGCQILQGNPFINKLVPIDTVKLTQNLMTKNWKYCKERYDLFFNLIYTIEKEYCLLEKDSEYYRSSEFRRERYGKMNYYDVMTKACHLPESYFGTRGKLYFPEEEHKESISAINRIKEKYDANYAILICLSGSSLHKRFQQAESVSRKILEKYPKSVIVLTGDKNCESQLFNHDRVISKVNKWNFRTVALMCKYFDLVISPETGLVCVSHSWDTPTIQLLTAASFDNHIKYAKNAYFVQSPVECSPCHKGPYKYYGCPRKDNLPACVFFNEDEIMEKVKEAYEHRTITSR
jgi:ADP-heptose:LPS heptosyltransferase